MILCLMGVFFWYDDHSCGRGFEETELLLPADFAEEGFLADDMASLCGSDEDRNTNHKVRWLPSETRPVRPTSGIRSRG